MINLKIVLKGIALITRQGETWNVYMPFDGCHTARLKIGSERPIDLNKPGQQVNIGWGGIRPLSGEGRNFEKFFNVNDEEAHSNGIYLRPDWSNNSLLISIPGGSYSAKLSQKEYTLRKKPIRAKKPLGRIGTEGTIEIGAEQLRLTAQGAINFERVFTSDTRIVIDNDCHQLEKQTGKKVIFNNKDYELLYKYTMVDPDGIEYEIVNDTGATELPCNNFRATDFRGVKPGPAKQRKK